MRSGSDLSWRPALALLPEVHEDLDRLRIRHEVREDAFGVAQALDRGRQQTAEPAGEERLGLDHVVHAAQEIVAGRIDRSDHDLVAEYELAVDAIARDL